MRAYPKVQVLERLTNGPADLIEEGFDLALRVHAKPLESSNLIQRTVCAVQLILVASPSFLDRTSRPQAPQDLAGASGLARDIYVDEATWSLEHQDGRQTTVAFQPVMASNDWFTLRQMAVAGLGIAAVPAHVCRRELDSGLLERVLPAWRSDHATLTILTPSRRGALPSVRAFIDFLLAELPPVMASATI